MQPRFTSLVAPLPSTVPFVGPEAQERARGVAFRARLGANESVFGPSPKAIAAMRQAAAECWMYCDPENYDRKQSGLAGRNFKYLGKAASRKSRWEAHGKQSAKTGLSLEALCPPERENGAP